MNRDERNFIGGITPLPHEERTTCFFLTDRNLRLTVNIKTKILVMIFLCK
jgi:hypothetical protein